MHVSEPPPTFEDPDPAEGLAQPEAQGRVVRNKDRRRSQDTGKQNVALAADSPAADPADLDLLRQANEGLVIAALESHKKVEQVLEANSQFDHFVRHDELTNLPNRTVLLARLRQAIEAARDHPAPIAVLFMDLDHFKYINDSLEHAVGDRLLQSVTQRLLDCVRPSDTLSRQGGDEFILLLPSTRSDEAEQIAHKIMAALMPAHRIYHHDLHIGLSIGISVFPDDGQDVETLIKNADTAMYAAKESGRNHYRFFEPGMSDRAVQRQAIETSLRRALVRQEFVLYYQPKINLQSGRIAGAEALIRWQHPERGLLAPAHFFSVAEEYGLILPMGRWALREACQQIGAWRQAGLPAIRVAVNTSALEFHAADFLQNLRATLAETGVAPQYLELELTESVLMHDAAVANTVLYALSDMGIQLTVDDFGTGYSSLSYLRRFPIDALKIDQSFVENMARDASDASLVGAVINIGKSLNQRVIAEGVESPEQYALLLAQQCDEGQGYYLGRPMAAEAFADLLRAEAAAGHGMNLKPGVDQPDSTRQHASASPDIPQPGFAQSSAPSNDETHLSSLRLANAHLVATSIHSQEQVEHLRRSSEQRYRTLFDSIDDGFCIIEKTGGTSSGPLDFRFVEANPAFATHSGLDHVDGKTIREVAPDEADAWLPLYEEVLTTGRSIRIEREFVAQRRVLEVHAFRVEDATYRRVGISFRDITRRKRDEHLLRSNHDTFFGLIQNAPFGLYVVDAQFRLCQVSTASQKAFANVHPLLGRDFAEVVRRIWSEPFASEVIARFRHTLDTGEAYAAPNTTELRNDIPDVESYDWKIERITLPDGQFGVVCYFYDITERKKIEDALRESEAFNRSIINSSSDCIKVLDLEGNLLSILSGQALLGIDDIQPFLHTSWIDFWEAEHREAAQKAIKMGIDGVGNFVGFFRTLRGEPKWWDVSISPILDANRAPARLLAVSRDVTQRKHAEDALRESEQRYRTLFNQMDEGFCIIEVIFDAHETPVDWRFLDMNPAFVKLTGIPDALGKCMREIAPNHEDYWFEIYGKVCREGAPIRFVNKARELDDRWFDLYAFRLGGHGSRKVAVIFNNITERKQADKALRDSVNELRATEAELRSTQAALSREKTALADHVLRLQQMNEDLTLATHEARTFAEEVEKSRIRMAHLAQHDALTDLPNRILLGDRLAHAISLAHRHGKQFALMFLDLDRFKEINDSLGHAVGDQLLQSVAKRLTAAVRSSDTVCRLGGDEFIVLLAEIEHARDAELSADNILSALIPTHRIDQFELQVTVSIGISIYPDDGQSMDALIKNADAAMYQAKALGRNNYQFFSQTPTSPAVDQGMSPHCNTPPDELRRAQDSKS